MIKKSWFGTDGIRGHVGTPPITAEFALRLGHAAGRVLAKSDGGVVVIGKDTRRSGYMLESALEAGLISAGADVRLLGPMPTPGVAHLTRAIGACAGIVISASHNPHHDNGFKFFSGKGEKIGDEVEHAIEAALAEAMTTVDPARLGRAARMKDADERYLGFVASSVPAGFRLDGLRIVLDCAHGATYKLAPRLFSQLGASVTAIGIAPDGLNINRGVGSTEPAALQAAVRAYKVSELKLFIMSDVKEFIDKLHHTHKAEWEATPKIQDSIDWLTNLFEFLFPNNRLHKKATYVGILKKNQIDLENILLSYLDPTEADIEGTVNAFYQSLETVYHHLRADAAKIYEFDPAATSIHEVIVSYPGFYAIAVYRIAHQLTRLKVPVLPRILSEYANRNTGTDIHPAAKIGGK